MTRPLKCLPTGIAVLALLFGALSCSDNGVTDLDDGDPSDSTATLTEMAVASLEDALYAALNELDNVSDLDGLTFEPTRVLFEEAYGQDPSNEVAALGLAMATIFVLEDNPQLRAAVDDWEVWLENHDELEDIAKAPARLGAATPFFWGRATLPTDITGGALQNAAGLGLARGLLTPATDGDYPPTIAEHQAVLRDVIVPALEAALTPLATVDDPNFVFVITPRMQGEDPAEADSLELDLTEVFAIRGGIELALATSEIALAYVFEPSPYGVNGFVTAMTLGSTFGTLATDGADLLASARQRLLSIVDIARDGLNFLENETDDQSNDIIKRDPGGGDGLDAQDIQDARDALDDMEGVLTGPYAITEDFGYGVVTVDVDLSQFFSNPITDIKAKLPAYEVYAAGNPEGETVPYFRFTAINISEWTFPDPTVNGVLPGMTSTDDLLSTFKIAQNYWDIGAPPVGHYSKVVIAATDCDADAMAGGNGCPVGTEWITDAGMNLKGYDRSNDAGLSFTRTFDTDMDGQPDSTAYEWYPGTFTATLVSGDTYSVQLDLQDQMAMPVVIVATLVDKKGYTGRDTFFRPTGGSVITFDFLGASWTMEKQF